MKARHIASFTKSPEGSLVCNRAGGWLSCRQSPHWGPQLTRVAHTAEREKHQVYNQQQVGQKKVMQGKLQLLTVAKYFPGVFTVNHPLQDKVQKDEGVVSESKKAACGLLHEEIVSY